MAVRTPQGGGYPIDSREINDADVTDYIAVWDASIVAQLENPGWFPEMTQQLWEDTRDTAVNFIKSIYDYDAGHAYNGLWA